MYKSNWRREKEMYQELERAKAMNAVLLIAITFIAYSIVTTAW